MTPLPEIVDDVIQASPIDVRRGLYKVSGSRALRKVIHALGIKQNIVLSGGSTLYQHFGQRLRRDIKQLVGSRLEASAVSSGSTQKVLFLKLHLISSSDIFIRPVLRR